MSLQQRIHDSLAKARQSLGYAVEVAKLGFIDELEAAMAVAQINKGQLAEAAQTSAPYITKVLRGDQNLTLESMVKLSLACQARLQVRVVSQIAATGYLGYAAHNTLPFKSSLQLDPLPTQGANDGNYALSA